MIIKIKVTPERAAEILAYEYGSRIAPMCPDTMTRQEIIQKVTQHYEETSAACRLQYGKDTDPIGWAKAIIRKARIWR